MIQEDRRTLQTSLGVNVVVEAGAGTGKTTLLIDRLCMCVLAHDTPVEKLVALTFTEKAAAEIKTRFIFKLQQILQALRNATQDRTLDLLRSYFKVKEEDIIARAEKALARLDRASIGTIHGFCAEILKTFPLEASLAPNVQIDEGTQGDNLFEARWNRFLDEELGVNAARKEQWKAVLAEISLEELKSFAQELCSGKIEKYDYYAHVDLLLSACREKQQRSLELSRQFLQDGAKPRMIEKALLWTAASLQRTALFLQRKEFPPQENLPTASKPTRPKDWEEDLFEEALGLYQFAQKITPEKQKVFLMAYQLISPVCEGVRQDYREAGLVSFDDLIIKTRNLLRENLYVRRLLKEKFDAIFVDEFQDTDPVQGELLLFLAEEKPRAATRWQEVHLLPGKLFIVGDPKQSIYRFRGADITAYELFIDLILRQGGKKFFLQKNFRSTSEIIETANSICSRAMVQQSSFQPAYVPIFTEKEQRGQSVEWLFVTGENQELSADDFRHNQAHCIARWIDENVGVRTLADGRKLGYKDIALLLRASTQTSFYTDAFQRQGIPFSVEVDKDFFRKQEINDFLNFLQAVADPSNKIALAGVLRSPLVGMNDEELYQFVVNEGWSACGSSQNPKVRYGYELIEKFRNLAGRISAKELVRRVLDETFLPQACAVAYDGPRSVSHLQQLVKLIDTYHTQETSDAATFFARLQREVQETPELLAASSSADSTDAVSVLTVHKSKGLEFPVVILADLTRQDSSAVVQPPAHIFSWQYDMHGLRAGKVCDVNLAFLEEEQKKHSRCEEIRILYVALTRAKENLILVGDARPHAQKNAAPFAQAGLFPNEEKSSFVSDGELKIPVTYIKGTSPDLFRYRQLPQVYKEVENEVLQHWKESFEKREKCYASLGQQKAVTPSQMESWEVKTMQQEQGAELGTFCHRVLELLLSQQELTLPSAITLAAQQSGMVSLSKQAHELLAPFVCSSLFKQIQSYKVLACELPFSCLTQEGEIVSGLIDVLAEKPDGSLWVLDYKTDQVLPGQERALLQKKYEAQLRMYQQAAEKLFPLRKVTTAAIFVRTFAAIEL